MRRSAIVFLPSLIGSVKGLLERGARIGIAGQAQRARWLSGQIARAIIVLLLGLGVWLGHPTQEARAFGTKGPFQIHQGIVMDALGSIFAAERLEIIKKAVYEADTGVYEENEAVHFDNSAFTSGSEWIKSQYVKAVNLAGSCNTQEEALRQWGLLLHTTQDFYSHSNFIEKGGQAPVGAEFLTMRNKVDDPRSLTAIVKGIEVKSGYYTGIRDLLFRSGNCSTEAAIQDNTSRCSHGDINKDQDAYGLFGRPRWLFPAARRAAVEETIAQWQIFQQKIREQYGNDRGDQIIEELKHGYGDQAKTRVQIFFEGAQLAMALLVLYFARKIAGPARTPALLAGACFALGFLAALVGPPNIKSIHMDLRTISYMTRSVFLSGGVTGVAWLLKRIK